MSMTHDVINQVPPLDAYNLFTSDPVLPEAMEALAPGTPTEELVAFGEATGAPDYFELGADANRNDPVLHTHDRYGHRIDQVEFHPAWHSLMEFAVTNGNHSLPWEGVDDGHLRRAACTYMTGQVESGHNCPISMTYSVVPALKTNPKLAATWLPRLFSRTYDPRFLPAGEKQGVLMGMGMTEKQGGSDVRANTTVAEPLNGDEYRLTGHKWFTSAPMCDAFLVLAQAPGGLTCFFLPRFDGDDRVNRFHIQRLKDKLGNRSNASGEIEFDGAWAIRVGEEGRGVPTIIEMVNGTRLDCVIGSVALMRQAVSQAAWHVAHRSAFGSRLVDKPLMRNVIADLELETEVATLMMARLAAAFDRSADDPVEAAMKRIALPVAKYWVTKRTSEVVREALECLGGNGYVEESIMPRLYRESPLNAIWEGSGNVIALDLLRAVRSSPGSLDALVSDMESGRGVDPRLDRAIDRAAAAFETTDDLEFEARRIIGDFALAWGGALLAGSSDASAVDLYCTSRIERGHGGLYGTLPRSEGANTLVDRALPTS